MLEENSRSNNDSHKENKKKKTIHRSRKSGKVQQHTDNFLIVGIGSSAGGLEALQVFFRTMPADCGMGFVVVTHQHPGHESILPALLSHETDMPVVKIEDGMTVKACHVYVLGPGSQLTIDRGHLHLQDRHASDALHMPIDIFFRSLAHDMHERAVCIVLSGTGSDGTIGLKEIKAQRGMAMAQQPPSAKYGGMPSSAQGTGLVDFIEPPERMPKRLIEYVKGTRFMLKDHGGEGGPFSEEELQGIIRYVRSRTGHDFSMYKNSTIRRRIERRMNVHGLKKPHEYLNYLHENRQEAQMLFSELLISVTSFFRDSEAFEALQNKYLPELFNSRPDNYEFRVWVPGCATGEEAYSVAILLDEVRQMLRKPFTIRIFGTDLDDQAIQRARSGIYPASISVDVSRQRLEYYFIRDGDDAFQVRKDIREMLIFAQQNMLSDPPFMRLDLLVCRNVLIYLQNDLQKLLLPTFHYALNPEGLLFLGSSESVGTYSELFETLDVRWKIYRRKEVPTGLPHLPAIGGKTENQAYAENEEKKVKHPPQVNRLIERLLINLFAPISIIIDHNGTIVYIHGRTGAYLEPEEQQPRNNIFEMAREGLRLPLSAAVHRVLEHDEEVKRKNLSVKTNGGYQSIDLTVRPIKGPEPIRNLILLSITAVKVNTDVIAENNRMQGQQHKAPPERIKELERELLHVRESNQVMVEELQSTNEELQSANEELQSTNEELQSSKEEMESLNEELSTVNNELSSKVQQLSQARDDMKNLLNSTDLAVIFLDQQLRVKRYTEKARTLISLRESDIGRPIEDLSAQFLYDHLLDDCREVLDTLVRKEEEVKTREGTWQLMRILPYRTSENIIGGVAVTFVNITRLKEAEQFAKSAKEYFQSIVDTVREPLVVLDSQLQVQSVNSAFCRLFSVDNEQMLGKRFYDVGEGQWNIPTLRNLLEQILSYGTAFSDYLVEHDFSVIGYKRFMLNARRLEQAKGLQELILLAIEEQK